MARKEKKAKQTLSREQSLSARPLVAPILERIPIENGGQRVIMSQPATKLMRWVLRTPKQIRREFEFDSVGIEVLGLCNGRNSVKSIGQQLAKRLQLDGREAELAVATFLRTLVQKGLVEMVIPKGGGRRDG